MTARFQLTALDCPHPVQLGRFYERLTGGTLEPFGDLTEDEIVWIELDTGNGILAFQKIAHYVAPTWPEGNTPQQLHLDFTVPNLDEGEAFVLSLGATKADFQPGKTFRIYLDPVGHPFCLVERP